MPRPTAADIIAAAHDPVVETPRRSLRGEPLRRLALEVAVRLDARGLHAEAQAIFDESALRDEGAPGALADATFETWLRSIDVRLNEEAASAVAA